VLTLRLPVVGAPGLSVVRPAGITNSAPPPALIPTPGAIAIFPDPDVVLN
jgi:hypothetical protein